MRSLCLMLFFTFLSMLLPSSTVAAHPVTLLLEAPSAIKMIGEYLGLIESLDSKVERLLDADLKTAVSLFEQAEANPRMSGDLMTAARIYFTRAAAIQSDSMDESRRHKQALALLGLWACCKSAGDDANADATLKRLATIPELPSTTLFLKCKYSKYEAHLSPARTGFPSIAECRKYSHDYNSLLVIIEAVDNKIQSARHSSTQPSIVGRWKGDYGRALEFFADGSVKLAKLSGTYQQLEGNRMELSLEGFRTEAGTIEGVVSYRLYSDLLIIRSAESFGTGVRFTRLD